MSGDRQRSLAAGCDDHWTKPIVDLAVFKRMVWEAAQQRRPLRLSNGVSLPEPSPANR